MNKIDNFSVLKQSLFERSPKKESHHCTVLRVKTESGSSVVRASDLWPFACVILIPNSGKLPYQRFCASCLSCMWEKYLNKTMSYFVVFSGSAKHWICLS